MKRVTFSSFWVLLIFGDEVYLRTSEYRFFGKSSVITLVKCGWKKEKPFIDHLAEKKTEQFRLHSFEIREQFILILWRLILVTWKTLNGKIWFSVWKEKRDLCNITWPQASCLTLTVEIGKQKTHFCWSSLTWCNAWSVLRPYKMCTEIYKKERLSELEWLLSDLLTIINYTI